MHTEGSTLISTNEKIQFEELQKFLIIDYLLLKIKKTYNKSKEYVEFAESRVRRMELAKITAKGQITIPIHIRKKLNLKDGDKVVFIEENGRVIMENSTKVALREVQEEFKGEAERLGLKTEDDSINLVKQVRKEMWEERHANND